MWDFLFGFNRAIPAGQVPTDWIGTWSHFWLFLAFILSSVLFCLITPKKSKKRIIATKIALIIFLFTFEVGRMVWRVLSRYNGADPNYVHHDWIRTFSFTICAIHVWLSIFVLIASLFVDNKNRTLQVFLNILFGSGAIGGVLSFIHPEHISGYWHILHWNNLQTVVIHAALVWVPLYFVKTGELKPRMENRKYAIIGFVSVFTFITMVSHWSGYNFSMALGMFEVDFFLGTAALPLLVYIIAYQIAGIFYLPFEANYRLKNQEKYQEEKNQKILEKQNMTREEKVYYYLPRVTFIFLVSATFAAPLLLGANMHLPQEYQRALREWYSIFIITPLILQVFAMYFSSYKRNQLESVQSNI